MVCVPYTCGCQFAAVLCCCCCCFVRCWLGAYCYISAWSYVTYACTLLMYICINPITCAVVGIKTTCTLLHGLKVYKHAYIHITHMDTQTLPPLSCLAKSLSAIVSCWCDHIHYWRLMYAAVYLCGGGCACTSPFVVC